MQDGVALVCVLESDLLQVAVKQLLCLAQGFARYRSVVVNSFMQHACFWPCVSMIVSNSGIRITLAFRIPCHIDASPRSTASFAPIDHLSCDSPIVASLHCPYNQGQ